MCHGIFVELREQLVGGATPGVWSCVINKQAEQGMEKKSAASSKVSVFVHLQVPALTAGEFEVSAVDVETLGLKGP